MMGPIECLRNVIYPDDDIKVNRRFSTSTANPPFRISHTDTNVTVSFCLYLKKKKRKKNNGITVLTISIQSQIKNFLKDNDRGKDVRVHLIVSVFLHWCFGVTGGRRSRIYFHSAETSEWESQREKKQIFILSSTNQIKFLISLWSNLCDSVAPPPPLLTYVWPLSEARQPCQSRHQDNPKDVSSALMHPWERPRLLLQLRTPRPHQWKHFLRGRPNLARKQKRQCKTANLCVTAGRPSSDSGSLPRWRGEVVQCFVFLADLYRLKILWNRLQSL